MRKLAIVSAAVLLAAMPQAWPATVLFCPFESLDGWEVRTIGSGDVRLVVDQRGARSLRISSQPGTAFVSRELPLAQVRGCRVTVQCSAKAADVKPGPQKCSTAKAHLSVQTPAGIVHHSARFAGTSDWHREGFTADVPADATRVRLNLGLEACWGAAQFDTLVVKNEQRGVHHLDMTAAANANHGQLGLDPFPKGEVKWKDVTFKIAPGATRNQADCLRLRSVNHPDWPPVSAAIPVNAGATAVYILQAALDGKPMRETPCAIWTAKFSDGHEASLSVFEGREIGAIGQTKDTDNWAVAWKQKDKAGRWITFGVTKWRVYSSTPIASLSCRAYRGASPVVLAVTAVEEPPEPEPEEDDGEGGYLYE